MYADMETLWRTTMRRNPDSWMAHDNLGVEFERRGEVDKAIDQYRISLGIKSDNAKAYYNLGLVLDKKGLGQSHRATAKKSGDQSRLCGCPLRMTFGRLTKKGELEETHRGIPKSPGTESRLSGPTITWGGITSVYAKSGQVEEPMAQLQKCLQLRPGDLKGAKNLPGNALLRKGDFDAALACYEKTAVLGAEPVEKWNTLAGDFLRHGELDEAIACYQQTLRLHPRPRPALNSAPYTKRNKCGKPPTPGNKPWPSIPINFTSKIISPGCWRRLPEAGLRNGTKAVALAEQARLSTSGNNPVILHTLAAAYAESGPVCGGPRHRPARPGS